MKSIKTVPIILIVFGLIVVFFPEIIAFLLGGFFIFLGINGLILSGVLGSKAKKTSKDSEPYVKVGDYKIYR